jgi:tRNA G18 (ribose-2'-O)-methylase SpoU
MNASIGRRLIRIEDADDPRVAPFRNIRERDLVGREQRFVAEGTVVLNVLADVHGKPGRPSAEMLLVLENRLAGIASLLERFPVDVPLMVVPRTVMDEIAGFPMHRGVLALGRVPDPVTSASLLSAMPESALVLVAVGISNHDNMGALFRNAAAFGADALLLDGQSCDPLYRKAIRVSVGHALRVPFARAQTPEGFLEKLAAENFTILTLSPRGETTIEAVVPTKRMAIVVGTEGEGLPAELLSRTSSVRIRQAPGVDSLNLATAAALALHDLALKMGRLG